MPLSHQHQMTIIKDILTNHIDDGSGTVSECEQVERLAKSLISNNEVNDQLKNTLTDVYSYSQEAINSKDLTNHVNNHQQQLTSWVNDFEQYT